MAHRTRAAALPEYQKKELLALARRGFEHQTMLKVLSSKRKQLLHS
jgi:hypothetical protein